MGAGISILIGLALVFGALFFYMVMKDIKTSALLLILAGLLIAFDFEFEERNEEEMNQKWHDFTVSNSCVIFEKNEKEGTISWKCADGIIYTKPAYLERTF